MGRYTPIVLLAAAVIVALVTSLATYRWLQEKKVVKEVVREVETAPMAVAVGDIPWGGVINREMVAVKPFMKGSIPQEHVFADVDSLVGKVVLSPIKANEPILRSRLAPEGVTAGGVPAVIKPSNRAVAVKVDKVIGVSGFVKAGDRVDVLVTLRGAEGKGGPVTKTVLENVLVLAAGTQVQSEGQGAESRPVDVITLEVTPEEAELLTLAATEGRIQLALRSYSDQEEVLTKGARLGDLLAAYRTGRRPAPRSLEKGAPRAAAQRAAPAPSPAYHIWTINGTETQAVKVGGE